jgi:hypothetical protein
LTKLELLALEPLWRNNPYWLWNHCGETTHTGQWTGIIRAFTVTKEKDDHALIKTGVIGTGTAVEKQSILDRYY